MWGPNFFSRAREGPTGAGGRLEQSPTISRFGRTRRIRLDASFAGKFKTICDDRAAAIDHTARRARKIVQVLNCRSGEIDSRAIVGQSGQSKVSEIDRIEDNDWNVAVAENLTSARMQKYVHAVADPHCRGEIDLAACLTGRDAGRKDVEFDESQIDHRRLPAMYAVDAGRACYAFRSRPFNAFRPQR